MPRPTPWRPCWPTYASSGPPILTPSPSPAPCTGQIGETTPRLKRPRWMGPCGRLWYRTTSSGPQVCGGSGQGVPGAGSPKSRRSGGGDSSYGGRRFGNFSTRATGGVGEQGGAAPGGDSASPQPEREAGASPCPVPPGLAVDYHNERLYWADAKLSVIGSIRLNGTDPIVAADSKRGECLTAALAARPRASILSAEPTASPGPAVLPGLAPHNPVGPSLHQPCRPKARR